MKELVINEQMAGQRLDKFLQRYLPAAGPGFLYKMLRKKNIVLNDRKASGKELLQISDVIKIYFSEETLCRFMGVQSEEKEAGIDMADSPRNTVLPSEWIVYEDDDLIAVNKPAGVLSQQSRPDDISLVEYLRGYLKNIDPHYYRVGPANRLDRNTSGLVLAAKHVSAAQYLTEWIRTRTIRKYYLTLASGIISDSALLDGYLTRDSSAKKSIITDGKNIPEETRQPVQTRIVPLLQTDDMVPATLLLVELITGRTHQIRAHLASAGHPIAGDRKYGTEVVNRYFRKQYGLKRPYLHAWKLVFPEDTGPFSQLKNKILTAELPEELSGICRIPGSRKLETELLQGKW